MNIREKVAEILSVLLQKEINVFDDVSMKSDSEWTSLKHIEIIITIEEEFAVSFEASEIPKLVSMTLLCEKIQSLL